MDGHELGNAILQYAFLSAIFIPAYLYVTATISQLFLEPSYGGGHLMIFVFLSFWLSVATIYALRNYTPLLKWSDAEE